MKVLGKFLSGLAIILVLYMLLPKAESDSDPRSGFVNMQRILIAKQISAEPSFLKVDRSPSIVKYMSEDGRNAHIVGSYRTRIMKEHQLSLAYQMRMSYEPQNDYYQVECFRLLDEISEGKNPCF